MTNSADPSQGPHLSLHDLQVFRPDGRPMFDPIESRLSGGELMIVQGPNGVGKSTLLRAILGLWPNVHGKISLGVSFDDDAVAYMPQQGQLQFFLPLTLGEIVEMSAGQPRQSREILDAEFWSTQWDSASGGERQKALLARIFRSPARLFLLDEPFNHLDFDSVHRLWDEISACLKRGASVLLVAHGEEYRIPQALRDQFPVRVLRLQGGVTTAPRDPLSEDRHE